MKDILFSSHFYPQPFKTTLRHKHDIKMKNQTQKHNK